MVLNVSQNPALGPTRLPSTLPPALRALSAARIGLEGPLEATALPDSLARIDLADNRLEGKLPGLAGAVDVILLEAVRLTGGAVTFDCGRRAGRA
jgi:hypothetical protein